MEVEQWTFLRSVGNWRDQEENLKIPRTKWKREHNKPESVGYSESSSMRDFMVISAYIF